MAKKIKTLRIKITNKIEGTELTLILPENKVMTLLENKRKNGEMNLKIEIWQE